MHDIWLLVARLFLGVPFVIWGVGFCDLKHEPSRPPTRLLEEIIACSRLCMVRDELTRQHLAGCSLPDPVPCPSLCAVDKPRHPGWGLLHVDNYTTAGADAYEAMEAYGREFARQTERPFLRTNNRIEPGREASLAEHLERYAAADLVLSSALHGCILAAGMGRRVVAVSGDRKIESFMAAAGLSDWVCDSGEVERLPQMLNALANQPPVDDFVARAVTANRAVAPCILAEGRS